MANDVLLLNTAVSVLAASYVYEYYVRKTFLKKEQFIAERRKLTDEKKKNRGVLRNVLPLVIADKLNNTNLATIPETERMLQANSSEGELEPSEAATITIADTFIDSVVLMAEITNINTLW